MLRAEGCGKLKGMKTFFILVLSGAVLLGLEVFVPGGIVGLIGGLLLLYAAFFALDTVGGVLGISLAILSLLIGCAMVFLVVKMFPKSFAGRKLSLETDMRDSHAAAEGLGALAGAEGITVTVLRPSGFAEIGEKRIDVVTRGEKIEAGVNIRVIEVEGNRVVVAKVL